MKEQKTDVAIIGAGISGRSMAYDLLQNHGIDDCVQSSIDRIVGIASMRSAHLQLSGVLSATLVAIRHDRRDDQFADKRRVSTL